MLTLALDTVTDRAGVVIAEGGEVIFKQTLGYKRHAADLVVAVRDGVEKHKAEMKDITSVILADGPGSFTGIRIGIATVQGILADHEAAFRTAPSLKAQCYAASSSDLPVLAIYDALRGECFGAAYSFRQGKAVEILKPTLGTPDQILKACKSDRLLIVGPGLSAHRAAFEASGAVDPDRIAEGSQLAEMLVRLDSVADGLTAVSDHRSWKPNYGRLAEAQVRWEKEHGRPLGHS